MPVLILFGLGQGLPRETGLVLYLRPCQADWVVRSGAGASPGLLVRRGLEVHLGCPMRTMEARGPVGENRLSVPFLAWYLVLLVWDRDKIQQKKGEDGVGLRWETAYLSVSGLFVGDYSLTKSKVGYDVVS